MDNEAINKLAIELKALVNKYGIEYKMTLAEAVGMLEITKRDVIEEAIERSNAQRRADAEPNAVSKEQINPVNKENGDGVASD